MIKSRLVLSVSLAALLAGGMAVAGEIYKWVDEEGVTHFSDIPPDKGATPVEEVTLPEDVQVDEADVERSDDLIQRLKDKAAELEQEREQREQQAETEQLESDLEEALNREEIIAAPKKKKKSRRGGRRSTIKSNRERPPLINKY